MRHLDSSFGTAGPGRRASAPETADNQPQSPGTGGAAALGNAPAYHQCDSSQYQQRSLGTYQVASADCTATGESWQDIPLTGSPWYLKDLNRKSLKILDRIEAKVAEIHSRFGHYQDYQNNTRQVHPKNNRIMLLDLFQKWASDEEMKDSYQYTWGGFIELLEDIDHSSLAGEISDVVKAKDALGQLKKPAGAPASEMAAAIGSLSLKEKASGDELDEDDLKMVLSELETVKADYFNVGTSLGLRYSTVDSIRRSVIDPADGLREVLAGFLRKQGSLKKGTKELKFPTTWKTIVEAVGSSVGGNNTALAFELGKKYQVPGWS